MANKGPSLILSFWGFFPPNDSIFVSVLFCFSANIAASYIKKHHFWFLLSLFSLHSHFYFSKFYSFIKIYLNCFLHEHSLLFRHVIVSPTFCMPTALLLYLVVLMFYPCILYLYHLIFKNILFLLVNPKLFERKFTSLSSS